MPPSPLAQDVVRILELCRKERNRHRISLSFSYIYRSGLVIHASLGSYVVMMMVEDGNILYTKEVFERLICQDHYLWNALIIGYVKYGEIHEALDLYETMIQRECVIYANNLAFVSLLSACTILQDMERGEGIYSEIARRGFHETDVFIGSSLINMYAKCGFMRKANDVFNKQLIQNVVSWTALIAGYAEHGHFRELFHCEKEMRRQGILLDTFTFGFILRACAIMKDIEKGREVHGEVTRLGLLEDDYVLGSILVDMYAKCGYLVEALKVFEKLPKKDVVSWTAIVAGYTEYGHDEEALSCYRNLQLEGIAPNEVTFVCILNCCGSLGALCTGKEIHTQIIIKGLEKELFLGNSLINMYIKCGLLLDARAVFDILPIRDVVSWTALVTGYGQLGEIKDIYPILERMMGEGITPDLVTFRAVLNVCSHAGSIDKAEVFFISIISHYGLLPKCEHYNCLVDLFGRAGHIEKAIMTMEQMPFHPSITSWNTMLSSCQWWNNVELGKDAFKHSVQMNEKDTAAYVCMCNIYVNAAMHDQADDDVLALRTTCTSPCSLNTNVESIPSSYR